MKFIGLVVFLGMWVGLVGCGKKGGTVVEEVREAGYEMTAEGWFGAIGADDVGVMRKMIGAGFDEKTLDAEGKGALHAAAAAGSEGAAEYLLDRGFPVNEVGVRGRTPLMVAVVEDRLEMVKWLLRQGADPAVKDEEGFSAMMLAVTNGRDGVAEELAPFSREDLDAALLLAALEGQAGVIDALTNYGASVYTRMDDGRTPLMLAAENGHAEAVALLIDIGASRFATTDDGSTAQSMAVAAGYGDIAEMIATGFTGDALALETDEEVVAAMDDYLAELDPFQAGGEADGVGEVAGEGDGLVKNEVEGSVQGDDSGDGAVAVAGGDFPEDGAVSGVGRSGGQEGVRSLDGALVSAPVSAVGAEVAAGGGGSVGGVAGGGEGSLGAAVGGVGVRPGVVAEARSQEPPLVMRVYRQRELPVEVRKVSGGVASLNLAGAEPREVEVRAGDRIPGSSLVVVSVFTRVEEGKLNNFEPLEVGVMEVEDTGSGRRQEWIAGRSAAAHDPVALVEDAVSGERYVAKPGQRFRSAGGREFVVGDVRPGQLVIEEPATGEVRTLRLAGPKG